MNPVKISDSDDGQAADASISPVTTFPRLDLWLRLYAHALLRESQIFPGIKLCDESPGCSSGAFADIWKGDYRGEPVCVKVIRTRQWTLLKKIWVVCGSYFVNDVCTQQTSYQIYRDLSEGCKLNPHPNILPIEVSERPFPLGIMSPWMLNGNIARYTQTNPGANRLVLVRSHRPEDQ